MRRASLALAMLVAATVPVLGYHDPHATAAPQLTTYLTVQRRVVPAATVVAGFHDWRDVSKYRAHAGEHLGYDVAMPAGARVVAGWNGRVTRIVQWYDVEYGISVLSPNGYETTYGHLRPTTKVGAELRAGDAVGTVVNDHVDIKMRAPDGLYYDFGTPGAVAGRPANTSTAGRGASASGSTAGRPPTTASASTTGRRPTTASAPTTGRGAGVSTAAGRPAPRPTVAVERLPAPRPTANFEPRPLPRPTAADRSVAFNGTQRPWRVRPDRAELLRRYLRARYSVDLTREEAERAVAAERAAHETFDRNRRRLEEIARKAGLPVDLRRPSAQLEQLAVQLQHRQRDVASLHALLRRDEQALAEAKRALDAP